MALTFGIAIILFTSIFQMSFGETTSRNAHINKNGNLEMREDSRSEKDNHSQGQDNEKKPDIEPRNNSDNGSHYGWEKGQHLGWDKGKKTGWSDEFRERIWQGVENGTVITETTLTKKGDQIVKENDHYHGGMWLDLEEAAGNTIRMKVSAEFNEGKVVVINIGDELLKFDNLDDIGVDLDGESIEMGTSEEVIEAKGDEPKYVVAMDSEGSQFLVYIPHFSEHTIEIRSLVAQAKEELFSDTNYMIMAFGVLILIGIVLHVYKIGRGRK